MEAKPFSRGIPYWITRKDQINERSWSGGTVNQLFLFPGDADFEKKNFTCRISTATVDVMESIFTPFEGFDRIIMTTDDDLVLAHDGGDKITLKKYEPHLFDGGAETRSWGKVHDFNCIMDKKGCRGEVAAMTLAEGSVVYPRKGNYKNAEELEIIYCAKGRLTFKTDGAEERLDQGDVLVIDGGLLGGKYLLTNECHHPCDLVAALIRAGSDLHF
jgi:environmental stress-induced protein Ves